MGPVRGLAPAALTRLTRQRTRKLWCVTTLARDKLSESMHHVTFFTKDECTLCSAAWYVIQRVRTKIDFEVRRIDITEAGQEQWLDLYGNDIPVVHLNGKEVFRHRVDEGRLRKLLSSTES